MTSAAPTPGSRNQKDIQCLRGWAVLVVVLEHANIGPFYYGYLGVDIFFVVSGFLITRGIIQQIRDGDFSWPSFIERRAWRLFPAAYVVIASTALIGLWILPLSDFLELRSQIVGALTYTTNMVLWSQTGYFDADSLTKPLLHMWSLAIEEQFYLLFPLCLIILPKKHWLWFVAMLAFASLLFCFVIVRIDSDFAFYMLPARAWELLIGSVLALVWRNTNLVTPKWLLFASVLTLAILPVAATGLPHPSVDALVVCLATSAVIMARQTEWEPRTLLKPLSRLGDISYSVYLVHWPAFVFLHSATFGNAGAVERAIVLVVSMLLAALLYLWVERRFRERWKRQLDWRVVTSFVFVTITIAGLPFVITPNRDVPIERRPNIGLSAKCANLFASECRTDNPPQIAIWGDSFAMQLVSGVAKELMGGGRSIGVQQITMSSCAPIKDLVVVREDVEAPRAWADICATFNQNALEYLLSSDTIETVVLSGAFTWALDEERRLFNYAANPPHEIPAGLEATSRGVSGLIHELEAVGLRTILVGPAPGDPDTGGNCAERILAQDAGVVDEKTMCSRPVAEHRESQASVIAMLADIEARTGAKVVRLDEVLCDEVCVSILDGVPVYRDAIHLTYSASEAVLTRAHIGRLLYPAP